MGKSVCGIITSKPLTSGYVSCIYVLPSLNHDAHSHDTPFFVLETTKLELQLLTRNYRSMFFFSSTTYTSSLCLSEIKNLDDKSLLIIYRQHESL